MKLNAKLRKKVNSEKGSLVVEATIVFPVTFLIIIFLIFVGNMYYQRSKAQAIFTRGVIEFAARESNPMLEEYLDTGSLGSVGSDNDFKPYRYLNFSTSRGDEIKSKTETNLKNMGEGLFSGMNIPDPAVALKYKTYGIYAKVEAQLDYSITMPVKLFDQDENMKIEFSEYIEVPAMEGSEMVRNVNMIRDMIDRSEKASDMASKAGDLLDKFKGFAN